ncbi:MAG: hypothetical protein VB111_09560 [Clostridiaceae bacterium]|nr:hypothetical protein [Clostridiaceae bacterium]
MLEFRLLLEYGGYPVWINIDGMLEDRHPVYNEINSDPGLARLLDELQDEYNATFLDENNQFDMDAPVKPEVWESICEKENLAVRMIKARFGGRYAIVDDISEDFPLDGKDGI